MVAAACTVVGCAASEDDNSETASDALVSVQRLDEVTPAEVSAARANPHEFQRDMRIGDLRSRRSPKFVNAIEWRPVR